MRNPWLGLLALVVGLGWGAASHGSVQYSYFYVAGQSNYSAAPNGQVQVPLYLQEVSNDSTSLLLNEMGLLAAGLSVDRTSAPSSPASMTALLGNAGSVPDGFDGVVGPASVSAASASLLENNNFIDTQGVMPGPQENGISYVLLGTLTIRAGAVGGQTTDFTIGPYDASSGNTFTTTSLYDLDSNLDPNNPAGSASLYESAAATTFSVTTASNPAVPEPCTAGAFAAIVAMLACRSMRRKRP